MQSIKTLLAGLALISVGFASCQNAGTNDKATAPEDSLADNELVPEDVIKIAPVEGSPAFPDAALNIKDVTTVMQGTDSVKVTINYAVSNYELKKQTSSAVANECNNSADGQHIHFILDNKPYTALYEPTHTFTVPVNTEHMVMSFLSRSYHESIKNGKAGVLLRFSVDGKGTYKKLEAPSTPMVFYSRPKGDYVGGDTKNLLLDYYLHQTVLNDTAVKVKATINGNEFTFGKWEPVFIQNAPMGAVNVKLQLVDKNGTPMSGENTSVEQTVQLAAQEPIR